MVTNRLYSIRIRIVDSKQKDRNKAPSEARYAVLFDYAPKNSRTRSTTIGRRRPIDSCEPLMWVHPGMC
jgi:hypothetical protein